MRMAFPIDRGGEGEEWKARILTRRAACFFPSGCRTAVKVCEQLHVGGASAFGSGGVRPMEARHGSSRPAKSIDLGDCGWLFSYRFSNLLSSKPTDLSKAQLIEMLQARYTMRSGSAVRKTLSTRWLGSARFPLDATPAARSLREPARA